MRKKNDRAQPGLEIPENVAAVVDQAIRVQGGPEALATVARVDPDELRAYLHAAGLADDPDARALLSAVEEAKQNPVSRRRLIVAADLIWDPRLRMKKGSGEYFEVSSNADRLARGLKTFGIDRTMQIAYYTSRPRDEARLMRLTGGAFGESLVQDLLDAYRFLVDNYEEADEIFLFGFSRGAYVARKLVAMMRRVGVLRKEHTSKMSVAHQLSERPSAADEPSLREFRDRFSREVTIQCLGVWETVGALGVPVKPLFGRRTYELHDTGVSRIVKNAFQGLAIDETRPMFSPMLWTSAAADGQRIEQVWFSGVHADVGGGYAERGLSDISLEWMVKRAAECGLEFDFGRFPLSPDARAPIHDSRHGLYQLVPRKYRKIGEDPERTHQFIHPSVYERMAAVPSYNPPNLRGVELPVAST
jgi:hypothetical protein